MKFTISKTTPAQTLGYLVIAPELRGVIKGKGQTLPSRKGGDKTNDEYAKEKGITRRQASKQRRGY